jgi:hypothetical protein
MAAIPVAASSPARYQTMKLRRVIGRPATPVPLGCSTSLAMVLGSDPEVGFLGEIYHSAGAWPEPIDPRRRLGAQAHHLAARSTQPCGPVPRLRSSFTQLLLRSLRCSAPTHDLAHLDTNSLAANRWIRAWTRPRIVSGG